MVGAGEYNCGFVPSNKIGAGEVNMSLQIDSRLAQHAINEPIFHFNAAPDKKAGVTAIVLFDMRRRARLGEFCLQTR